MGRYRIHLVFLYLLNFLFVGLSYYLDNSFQESKTYTGFNYLFILNILYFIWACFSKLRVKSIHIFIIGLFFIGSEPTFENDHYRYLWEGKVIKEGFNPYKLPPKSKQLKHIEYAKKKDISYAHLTSIYPPLSQTLFVALSPFEYKTAFIILQLLGLSMLIYILFNLFRDNNRYLVFILPFLYKEFVQAVHIDILAFFVLVLCFKKSHYFKGIFLAFQVKILSIICLPFLILKGIFRDRTILYKTLGVIALIIVTLYLYPIKVGGYQSGASAYIEYWSWNSVLGLAFIEFGIDSLASRLILLGLFSLSYLYLVILYIKNDFKKTFVMSGIAFQFLLLFTPVLHPWYMFWPVMFMRVNRWYYYFLASSVMAYYPYGNTEYEWFGEVIQFVLLSCSIVTSLRTLYASDHLSFSSGENISIWLPSGSRTEL
jgi:hypothetical protein